jgi:hypothetical protein
VPEIRLQSSQNISEIPDAPPTLRQNAQNPCTSGKIPRLWLYGAVRSGVRRPLFAAAEPYLLELAARLNPDHALAHAGLAEAYNPCGRTL